MYSYINLGDARWARYASTNGIWLRPVASESSSTLTLSPSLPFLRFPYSKLVSTLFLIQWVKQSTLRVPLSLLTPPSSFVKRQGVPDIRQLLLQKRVPRHQLLIGFFKLKHGWGRADIPLSDSTVARRIRRLRGVRKSSVAAWGEGVAGACSSMSMTAGSSRNRQISSKLFDFGISSPSPVTRSGASPQTSPWPPF